MTHPKVSIIILNWNGLKDTIECLESLKKITYPNYEVIVVDNGSKGNDAQVLKEKFSDYIHLIKNDKNYGFTGGTNIGIRYALSTFAPDYFLLLNNDTVVATEFLTKMVEVAEADASIGIIGSKTYFYDHPNRFWCVWSEVNVSRGRQIRVGANEPDVGQYEEIKEVNYVPGSCFLIKRQVVEIAGLLDESYFVYWDDQDYCTRARKAGFTVVYTPHAKIWHKVPIKLKPWYKTLKKGNQLIAPPYQMYYITRNRFKFMKKHATKGERRRFLFYFFGYCFWFTAAVCLLYHRRVQAFSAFYRGVKDGLFDREVYAKLYQGN